MKLKIVAVGTKMPKWVNQAYDEYAKRLSKPFSLKLVEQPVANRSKSTNVETLKEQEGKKMLTSIDRGEFVVALDVNGKSISTEVLAEELKVWLMEGKNISILIGGPDGLSEACLRRAQVKWSLSAMTLPHPLVRVMLIEQIYRASTIIQNHPYHK